MIISYALSRGDNSSEHSELKLGRVKIDLVFSGLKLNSPTRPLNPSELGQNALQRQNSDNWAESGQIWSNFFETII